MAERLRTHRARSGRPASGRRGLATLWLIMALPVLLVLVGVAVDVGNLWFERAALENSLEAAALAAVTEWTTNGADQAAIPNGVAAGLAFAAANTVQGQSVALWPNGSNLVFGRVMTIGPNNIFRVDDFTNDAGKVPGVHAMAQYQIPSLWGGFGPYAVSGRTTAVMQGGSAKLIRIDQFEGSMNPPAFPPQNSPPAP